MKFNKEVLISCQDNIDLFSLHLPNPKLFLQKIIEDDDIYSYLQIYLDVYNHNYRYHGNLYVFELVKIRREINPLISNIINFHIINLFLDIVSDIRSEEELHDMKQWVINRRTKIIEMCGNEHYFNYLYKKYLSRHDFEINLEYERLIQQYNEYTEKINLLSEIDDNSLLIHPQILKNKVSFNEYNKWLAELKILLPVIYRG